jgi:hypothetical protein
MKLEWEAKEKAKAAGMAVNHVMKYQNAGQFRTLPPPYHHQSYQPSAPAHAFHLPLNICLFFSCSFKGLPPSRAPSWLRGRGHGKIKTPAPHGGALRAHGVSPTRPPPTCRSSNGGEKACPPLAASSLARPPATAANESHYHFPHGARDAHERVGYQAASPAPDSDRRLHRPPAAVPFFSFSRLDAPRDSSFPCPPARARQLLGLDGARRAAASDRRRPRSRDRPRRACQVDCSCGAGLWCAPVSLCPTAGQTTDYC